MPTNKTAIRESARIRTIGYSYLVLSSYYIINILLKAKTEMALHHLGVNVRLVSVAQS